MAEKSIKSFQENHSFQSYNLLITANQKFFNKTKVNGRIYQNGMQKKVRTELFAEGRNFVYLVISIKLVFRKSIVCTGILSLLIVQTNSLAIF